MMMREREEETRVRIMVTIRVMVRIRIRVRKCVRVRETLGGAVVRWAGTGVGLMGWRGKAKWLG